MKLVVLAGAKKGAEVPIKKDQFIIGRSRECSLRAGSDAISRKHCELLVTDDGLTARDMGSRNGTYVNGKRIDGAHLLSHGDQLKVGPLEFRYEAEGELKSAKKPKVKSVGEAVARAKPSSTSDVLEDDISDWLLGEFGSVEGLSIGETLTMRSDDTKMSPAAPNVADGADDAETVVDEESESDKKKEPGKLPFRPNKPKAKDSREAAAQILRDMSRRR